MTIIVDHFGCLPMGMIRWCFIFMYLTKSCVDCTTNSPGDHWIAKQSHHIELSLLGASTQHACSARTLLQFNSNQCLKGIVDTEFCLYFYYVYNHLKKKKHTQPTKLPKNIVTCTLQIYTCSGETLKWNKDWN